MPPHLAAHVHALLLQTGLTKTAKKLESEFGEEVRYPLFFLVPMAMRGESLFRI